MLTRVIPAVVVLASMIVALATTPAQAEKGVVTHVEFSSGSAEFKTTLRLTFDKPVTTAQKETITRNLKKNVRKPSPPDSGTNLSCNEWYTKYTDEGTWNVQYICTPEYAYSQWGFKLSSNVQAIIVSNVDEDGLWWWRNGTRQTKQYPHTNVPKNYQFHGVMQKMWNGDEVTYQDYFKFRHNVGSGGTGSVTIAGTYTVG